MDVFSVGALITSITSLALGTFVYIKQRKGPVNRSFLWAMFAVSIWSFGFSAMTTASHQEEAIWWIRYYLNLGAIFIPISFLGFVFSVLNWGREKWRILIPVWGITSLFLILNFTPGVFFRAEPSLGFQFFIHSGLTYPAFVIYFLAAGSYGLYLLLTGYERASGLKRNQLKYLFWTWLIGLLGGASTFLPTMNIDIHPWGMFLIPICLITEAYAIVKYRSMDINIVFRRGMVYSILLCLLTAVFLISLISFEKLFQTFVGYSSMVATAIAALVLAIFFQPLKDKVQALVDNVFFKGAYDYHDTLRKTSEAMTSILDLEKLVDRLLSPIIADMKVKDALLYLMNGEKTGLNLSGHRFHGSPPEREPCPFIPEDWALARRLEWEHLPLLREGIRDQMHPEEAEEIFRQMNRLGADLAVPVILQNELLGVLLLGPKLSGDLFSEDDLQLLGTLANQTAVAVVNAQLYDEVASIQEHQENILRNLESGVVTVDQEGRITTFNRAAERMTESKASEILRKDCRVLDEELACLLLHTLFYRKGRSGVEITLQNKNGMALPIGVTTSLLQSQQGSLLGAIALFTDLTEVKTLEREKWRADKLAYIGTLAASIAHEIKNPLVSIKTLAQLLPDRHADSEFRTHFSQIALKEVDRIDLLVSQMLDLRENSTPTRLEILRVEEIVEEILLLLSEQIQKNKIRVEREYRSFPYATRGDRFQLKQAFWNVILNSIQAMQAGGILTVRTELAQNGGESQERVILRISDTGNGIPEEHLGKIFDPFFTTKQEGTGLGLSICYKIIAEHRGTVQVESHLSRGTSLYICLPAIKP